MVCCHILLGIHYLYSQSQSWLGLPFITSPIITFFHCFWGKPIWLDHKEWLNTYMTRVKWNEFQPKGLQFCFNYFEKTVNRIYNLKRLSLHPNWSALKWTVMAKLKMPVIQSEELLRFNKKLIEVDEKFCRPEKNKPPN